MRAWQQILFVALSLVGSATAAAGEQPISVHYNTRVPYAYVERGEVRGLMAEPVARALKTAKLSFNWVETPFSRQMATIKGNTGANCMIGVFKKPGRERIGRYSAPVYQDHPQILLVRADDEAGFLRFPSLRAAITEGQFRLLIKESYSYGPGFDALLLARKGPTEHVYDENGQMLRMLAESMTDALIMAPEEANALIRHRELKPERFAYIRYPDTPAGEWRHLFCSFKVAQSVLDRFNQSLTVASR